MKKEENNKPRKKVKAKYIVLGIVALVIVAIVVSSIVSANAPANIVCTNPQKQTVTKTVNTSGTIESSNEKTYFSVGNTSIEAVNVKAGDIVQKDTVLYTYDEDALELAISEASLKISQSNGEYSDALEIDERTQTDFSLDEASEAIVFQQKVDTQLRIDDLKEKLKEKKKKINHDNELIQEAMKDPDLDPESEKYRDYQEKYNNNTAKLTGDPDIVKWTEELEKEEKLLNQYEADYKEFKTEKKSKQEAILTDGKRQALSSANQLTKLTNGDLINQLKAQKGGVKADFAGIVTKVEAQSGATLNPGTQILSISSIDDMKIKADLSKSDIEYVKEGQKVDISYLGKKFTGEVTKINKMATKSDNGAIVIGTEISINDPDDSFIIGAEAKVEIHVGESKDALTVPNLVVNYGSDGAFVYVIENEKIVKKNVKTGLTDDLVTEISDGLTADSLVVNQDAETFEEGMTAVGIVE